MLLPLHLLEKATQILDLEAAAADEQELLDTGVQGKVGVRLDITPLSGDSHLVRGEASGTLEVECARCLEPFKQPFGVTFNLILNQKSSTGLEWVEDEDQGVEDYQVRLGPDVTEVPLTAMIAEQLILNYNSHPLPEVDAAGRCVQCGRPAPTVPEPKKAAEPDPRWEKLANLKNGSTPRSGKSEN